ncbi:hypothetical protein HF086_014297 [Spodoptera exigua]|uniref:FLYWCH-type domain-containing protein n=1 Tax=Spodoptera exigua TaxID=7107 RepID=A0A922M6U7_SPOEX|nr:hypothetical protein HF086_014297 [Spodoptera exigua]
MDALLPMLPFYFTVEFIRSHKGNRLILYNGYTYYGVPSKTAKQRWRCSTHVPQGCRAFIITINEELTYCNEQHNHEPNYKDFRY